MNERIKKLRKHLKLSQEEFGTRIRIKRSSVSKLENGGNNPSNQTITLICREFGVNEVWLRTGVGGDDNMFTKISDDDRFSVNLGKLGLTENKFIQNGVNLLAEADPEKLKIIEDFMREWLGIK